MEAFSESTALLDFAKQWTQFSYDISKSLADHLNCRKPSVHGHGFCDCCEGVVKRPHSAQLAVEALPLEVTEFSTPLPFRKDLLDFSLGSFRALFRTELALRYLGKYAGNDKCPFYFINGRT